MAQPHEKVGVQIEAIARQGRLFGGATAANVGVSFDDRDFQACPRQVGREREPVVSSSDDDSIESRHSLLPGSSAIQLSLNGNPDPFARIQFSANEFLPLSRQVLLVEPEPTQLNRRAAKAEASPV